MTHNAQPDLFDLAGAKQPGERQVDIETIILERSAQSEANTAQQAFEILADCVGMWREGGAILCRKRLEPAGTVSDGWRIVTIKLCDRSRWIQATRGNGMAEPITIAEADQRDFWQRPLDMAKSILKQLGPIRATK